jgi:hypothetical protein
MKLVERFPVLLVWLGLQMVLKKPWAIWGDDTKRRYRQGGAQ